MFFDSLLASGCYRALADELQAGGGGASASDQTGGDSGSAAAPLSDANAAASEILTGEGAGISNAAPAAGLQPATTTDSAQAPAAATDPALVLAEDGALHEPSIPAEEPPQHVKAALQNIFSGAETHAAADIQIAHGWFASLMAKLHAVAQEARDWLTIEEARIHFATHRGVAQVQVKVDGVTRTLNRDGSFA